MGSMNIRARRKTSPRPASGLPHHPQVSRSVSDDNPARGALNILAAAATFSTMGAIVKTASNGLPPEMLMFLRNAFSLLIIAGGVVAMYRRTAVAA
jgi:Methyl coenzyme M reductase, alpha subunit